MRFVGKLRGVTWTRSMAEAYWICIVVEIQIYLGMYLRDTQIGLSALRDFLLRTFMIRLLSSVVIVGFNLISF